MNVSDAKDQIVWLIDALSHDMSNSEYRELLDEIGAEVEAREDALNDEEAG